MSHEHHPQHVPVLLERTLELLTPATGENYLDLTAGYGGHARAILERTGQYQDSTLVDRDDYALEHLSDVADKGTQLLHSDFETATRQLEAEGRRYSLILIDLGVSSPQLDREDRGFSFSRDGPLDMRMDRRQPLTAATLIDQSSVQQLTDIIRDNGEEPHGQARRIAELIVANRPFTSTKALADLIAPLRSWKSKSKIHPATRTFQALRIAVNDELGQIERTLPLLPKLLKPGGRVAVISFHSLEDRRVKRFFKAQYESGLEADLAPVTKKPVSGATDDVHNPRSRSAKLRVAVKK